MDATTVKQWHNSTKYKCEWHNMIIVIYEGSKNRRHNNQGYKRYIECE